MMRSTVKQTGFCAIGHRVNQIHWRGDSAENQHRRSTTRQTGSQVALRLSTNRLLFSTKPVDSGRLLT
jgi:hypothetical protein